MQREKRRNTEQYTSALVNVFFSNKNETMKWKIPNSWRIAPNLNHLPLCILIHCDRQLQEIQSFQ
jgi:hypothetical protein